MKDLKTVLKIARDINNFIAEKEKRNLSLKLHILPWLKEEILPIQLLCDITIKYNTHRFTPNFFESEIEYIVTDNLCDDDFNWRK